MTRDALFSNNIRIAILLIAMLSLAASVITALYGERNMDTQSNDTDSFGIGPLGHKAFVEFLESMGFNVHRLHHGSHDAITTPVWFLEPESEAMLSDGKASLAEILLSRYHADLPTVVVLPKWELDRDPRGKRTIRPVGMHRLIKILDAVTLDEPSKLKVDRAFSLDTEGLEQQAAVKGLDVKGLGAMDSFHFDLPDVQTVTLKEGEGYVLAGTRDSALAFKYPDEESRLVILSDPDLLHNFNMQRSEHAAFLYALARKLSPSRNLVLDETFHGHARIRSLRAALGEYPPVLIIIQSFLAALLCLWAGLKRFGVPIALPPRRGRGPREVVSVAASLLARGERLDLMVGRYLTDILDDLGTRLKIVKKGDPGALPERLDMLAARRNQKPNAVYLHRTALKIEQGGHLGDRAALKIAEAAWKFRNSMLSPVKHTGG